MAGKVKIKTGDVVSDKMHKTIVVAVHNVVKHPLYQKRVRQTRKFKAHDENNEARIGDIVRIAETRPISKEKSWRLIEIIRRTDVVTVGEESE
jgi:small subunit ribosomal protein S17